MHGNRQRRAAIRLFTMCVAMAMVATACGGAARSPESASPGASFADISAPPTPTESPGASPSIASLEPSPTPTPVPTATPSPTPPVVVVSQWSKPQRVTRADCLLASVILDESGRTHVASECKSTIEYAVSNGNRWESTRLPHPADRIDQGSQLAIDGNVLYLGFTRMKAEDGGCGDDGLRDVGVYVRQRLLPAGDWSAERRIGTPTDGLIALRVANGVIHATVKDRSDGRIYYEKVDAESVARYRLPGAVDGGALRIGSDGRARIVYEAARNLQYAVFDGSGFSRVGIPASSLGWGASLVLDSQNHAHALWTRSWHDGGCAEPEPESWFGTYYGTNETGAWTYRRISTSTDGGSMTLDTDTGQVHVAVAGRFGIRYLTRTGTGPWKTVRITTKADWQPIIKLAQQTGKLVVVYNGQDGAVFAVTRAGATG
jgi:hypothetical protein